MVTFNCFDFGNFTEQTTFATKENHNRNQLDRYNLFAELVCSLGPFSSFNFVHLIHCFSSLSLSLYVYIRVSFFNIFNSIYSLN